MSEKQLALVFTAPGQVEISENGIPMPAPGQVRVRTLCSAISAGTESLLYQGLFPPDLPLDENIPALAGRFHYPLSYGYCAAGQIETLGTGVDPAWLGRLVFAFQPHASHFLACPSELLPVPQGLTAEEAVFLPNTETAVNFLLDGAPLLGERVLVFGQGIIGLLTTALLANFPLAQLIAFDRYPLRRQASLQAGAHVCLDPDDPQAIQACSNLLGDGADLAYELSGAPQALDQALAMTGFAGRIVIGSWYGQKRANLNLGGAFHRSRIRLFSSQVSTLAPELSGRWTKSRRFDLAWQSIRQVQPQRWITQRFPIAQAAQAYRFLAESPAQSIQIIFEYPTASSERN